MSIEKVKKLIQTAPEFSQWWKSNYQQIAHDFKDKNRWGRAVFTASVYYAAILMPTVIWGSAHFKSNLGAWGVNWLWFAICVTGVGATALFALHSVWEKRRRLWPKKAPRPLPQFVDADDFLDEYGDIIPSATPLHQKEILETMLCHPNVELQIHATELLALKDMDLPHVWWRALELCLHNVETVQQPVPASQTDQQKLDNVYVEIERVAQSQTTVSQALKL